MKMKRLWIILGSGGVAIVFIAFVLAHELWKCQFRESSPIYSQDGRFYSQMQFTLCEDRTKSRATLVLGTAGQDNKVVLLELGPEIGTVHVNWHDGPELHVQAPAFAIRKRYGPYPDYPKVVVTSSHPTK